MFKSALKILWRGAKGSYYHHTYTPTDVILFLTYRCTSQCKACNIWQRPVNKDEELTWEEWEPIFEKLKKTGVKSIELFGGDALLRKDLLYQMIRYCRENNIQTYFPTNSSSLTEETAKLLVEAGLSTIFVSFDELDDIGGQIRGVKRHAERVVKGIQRISKARGEKKTPQIEVITTVSGINYSYLLDFVKYSKEAGADSHEFRAITEFTTQSVDASCVNGVAPEPYFMPTDSLFHGFTPQQADELLRILDTIRSRKDEFAPMRISMTNMKRLKQDNLTTLEYPDHNCLFCTTIMVLTPYGDVIPCVYFNNYHLGNLTDKEVFEVWGNGKHLAFCKQQQNGDIAMCKRCSIRPYHRGFSDSVKNIIWLAGKKLSIKASQKTLNAIGTKESLHKSPVPIESIGKGSSSTSD